ncbi:MAG TPA: hypothetical protein VG889_20460 [Rhizomicrobium sp.]|nr:hypothetical protein [Rhizomicrobium sp.]
MASKIPVGRTIARSYGFAFGNLVNNLGAIWIPVAILYALTYFFQKQYMAALLNVGTRDPGSIAAAMPFLLCATVVFVLLFVPQVAALAKEALGLRKGNAFLQFPFGADAWRLIGAYLLFYVVLIVIYILLIVASLVLGIVAGSVGDHVPTAAAGLIGIAIALFVVGAILYITVRMSFLLPPVVVAEQRVSLIRGWELTKGNFWRIFLIVVVLILPFAIAEGIYVHYVYGDAFLPPLHATPEQLDAFMRHQQEINRAVMARTQQYWFLYYPVALLVSLVMLGLFSGAAAFSYRVLSGTENGEAG